ncbi:MAG: FtsX-like permease family protein [Ignavibacteria bacterium]|nr:FtsX-like permease family protein [Ignavibacteria bacterium]
MNIKSSIIEAYRSSALSKAATLSSILTISLSLILIAIYMTISVNTNKIIKNLKDKIEIEIFLDDNIKLPEINSLKERVKTIAGVKSIIYVPKDSAAKIFENEFGKDLLDIFETNPLPPSLKVILFDEYKTADKLAKVREQLKGIPKVQDIVYSEKSIEVIDNNISAIIFLNITLIIILLISCIFIVSNTIRINIKNSEENIKILYLHGATTTNIKTQYIIQGIIMGLAASVITTLILFILYFNFTGRYDITDMKIEFLGIDNFAIIFIFGIILGITGSYFGTRKLHKIQK